MFTLYLLIAMATARVPPQSPGPCPWLRIESFSITKTTITINGMPYLIRGRPTYDTGRSKFIGRDTWRGYVVEEQAVTVKGDPYWHEMYTNFERCGEHDAAEALRGWRASYRSRNWSLIAVPYTLPWTIWAAIRAKDYRTQLEVYLRQSTERNTPPAEQSLRPPASR